MIDSESLNNLFQDGEAVPLVHPPKRGPGRPRKDAGQAPAEPPLETGNAGEPVQLFDAPKKRGRKPGSTNKTSRDLTGITQLLLTTHIALASLTKYEELALSPDEAGMLASSLAGIAEHYKIRIDGKAGAIMTAIYTVGVIYGPRAFSIGMKIKNSKTDEPAKVSENVTSYAA